MFLSKALGREHPHADEIAAARAELASLCQQRPSLAAPATLLGDVLPMLFADGVKERLPAVAHGELTSHLHAGTPAFRFVGIKFHARSLRKRCLGVCRSLPNSSRDDAVATLADALEQRTVDPATLARHVLAGESAQLPALIAASGVDPELTATVLRLALFPVLSSLRESLAESLGEYTWNRGYCPLCGSSPLLAEYRGLEQLRFLRCGLCAADWEFPRLACPCCGNRDHRTLGYFTVAGEAEQYRTTTCDACRGYTKTVSTLGPLSPPGVLVADVATMHLDLVAAGGGFTPLVR